MDEGDPAGEISFNSSLKALEAHCRRTSHFLEFSCPVNVAVNYSPSKSNYKIDLTEKTQIYFSTVAWIVTVKSPEKQIL